MNFSEKLDFLMAITKTSNSSLALATNLDPSYISRLRKGKRLMPKDEHIIQKMAVFLARQFKDDLQNRVLLNTLKPVTMPKDVNALALQLGFWLSNHENSSDDAASGFFNALSVEKNNSDHANALNSSDTANPNEDVSVYFGIEGKRKAAECFLSEVAACETPQTLLLYSDEDTTWMTDDPAYARRWAELMVKVISRGNRIKIIHTISRNLDEMLSALTQWMPLYMSGMIEPYYYQKKRDGIFKRTLFIAPKTAAVVSNSVGEQVLSAANVLYRNEDAIHAFSEEFMEYLRLCKPLMQIFTAGEHHKCRIMLNEFEDSKTNALIKTESLSLLTMPQPVRMQILERSEADEYGDVSLLAERCHHFLETLKTSRFTELICLPEIDSVKNGKVKVSMSYMLSKDGLYYTKEEFIAHLEHIIALLENFENYNIHLIERTEMHPYTIYVKEELGVIIANHTKPPVVIAIKESNMIAAFLDALKNVTTAKSSKFLNKDDSVSKLKNYISKLRG
ncbi:MAG: transcriptional regulator [Bacillota bacterium]|nr:transcriptional regulator [Bacillota bacterium]